MMDLLRCLLLPVLDKTLIVPYSAVAEVVPYEEKEKWSWRGIEIPLIYLEKKEGEDRKKIPRSFLHVAVLNRCTASKGPDFVGLVLQTLPSMSRCKRSDIQAVAVTDKPYLSQEITLRGKQTFIPNLIWIWENLSYFHPTFAS